MSSVISRHISIFMYFFFTSKERAHGMRVGCARKENLPKCICANHLVVSVHKCLMMVASLNFLQLNT